jgi:hypothetical protein
MGLYLTRCDLQYISITAIQVCSVVYSSTPYRCPFTRSWETFCRKVCDLCELYLLCERGRGITFVTPLDKTNSVITEDMFKHGNKSHNYRTPLPEYRLALY